MALRRGQDARGFATGLAEVAIGSARNQAALALHPFEQSKEGGRRQRQMLAQGGKGPGGGGLTRDDVHQQAGDQHLGFLVPMRLGLLVVCVMDQRVGERHAVVGNV